MAVLRTVWLCAVVVATACGSKSTSGAPEGAPNVLLISLDSVRRDMLGCYGASFAGRSPSPNLDRLAAEGLRVEDGLASTSWTLPAHVTLFTGVPELVHGVEQDGQCIADELPTLAERLRDAGWRTAGVYSGPYLDPRFGFGRGFERYRAGYGPELAAAARAAAEALARVHAMDPSAAPEARYQVLEDNALAERALEVASHRDSSSRTVTELALDELAQGDGRPFFLFAHYFDPHYDYVPPAPFERAFDPDYAGAVDGRDFARRLVAPAPAPRDLTHLRALQAGEVAWTDGEIGRLLSELERRGLAANTLVVVVSDHGEEFLEHGNLGHRRTLYEEAVRVPILLRMPARIPAGSLVPAGSLADVAPSVLALLGLTETPPPLLEARTEGVIARLVLNPTGTREGMRVLESYRLGSLKLLRQGALAPAPETGPLRWIDLERFPDEREAGWSSDFGDARARAALERFRTDYARGVTERRAVPLAAKTEDLLAAFRGLGYVGEEARVGAVASDELVLPPPEASSPGTGSAGK